MSARVGEFIARASDDDLKRELELTHEVCETVLCDIEGGDTFEVLLNMIEAHTCPHPDTIASEDAEGVEGCSCGMADYGAPGHDGHDS